MAEQLRRLNGTEAGCTARREIRHARLPRTDTRSVGTRQEEDEDEDPPAAGNAAGSEFEDEAALGRVALATETPIRRVNWWGDVWEEILDMDGMRTERMPELPMLAEHTRFQLVGRWMNAGVDQDRVLRAEPRFSRNRYPQEVRNDVLDGIRSTTSIGYRIWAAQLESVDEDGVERWRFTDWEPLEASWELIPADLNSGVGRQLTTTPAATAREDTMAEKDPKATPAGGAGGEGNRSAQPTAPPAAGAATAPTAPTISVEELRSSEQDRIRTLTRLGQLHQRRAEEIDKWVSEGTSVEQASRTILDDARSQPRRPTTPAVDAGDSIGLSRQDRQRYSLRKAIMQDIHVRTGGAEGEKPAFEMEVSRALETKVPSGYRRRGGVLIPSGIAFAGSRFRDRMRGISPREGQRDGLDTATQFAGQELVFEEYAGFIELLRSRALTLQLGATFLPGLQGDAQFVKQTAAATAEWVDENPGSDMDDSELALALITLRPKTLMGSTFFSRQLFRQSVEPVDTMVEDDLTKVHARAIDLAVIHGTGANNQPTGAYEASGVNAVLFGGAISFAKVVEMETVIAEADGDVNNMAYLTTPGIRGAAKTTEMFEDSNGRPIWTGSVDEGEMNGYRAAASTQVRSDLAADGSGTTPTPLTHHGMVFGDWSSVLVGEWGMLELITDPFTKKKQGLIEVTSFQMADIQFRYAEKLAKALGLLVG